MITETKLNMKNCRMKLEPKPVIHLQKRVQMMSKTKKRTRLRHLTRAIFKYIVTLSKRVRAQKTKSMQLKI